MGICVGSKAPVLVAAAVVAVVAAGCGSSSTSSSTPAATTSGSSTTAAASGPGQIIVPLGNEPSGTVNLSWDPGSKIVTAKLQMSGFTPGSSHAMHIHNGSCAQQGDVLIPFGNVTADDKGVINTAVQSTQPSDTGLAAGTLLNIHLGSVETMGDPGQPSYMPISCADIDPSVSSTLQMAPLPQFGDHPQSQAILQYDPAAKTLTVPVRTTGLVPGSAHAVHIHLGTCDSQGSVKYHLNDLVASKDGVAESTTIIDNVTEAPPAQGWYVNVHLGSHDEIEKDGKPTMFFAPILCGNITK